MGIKNKKTALFFGSFNPVHVGHMIIANYMIHTGGMDEVWMIVSPHNPLKEKASLAKDHDRLHLVNLAIGNNYKIKASNIEFSLPKPSYTIDTLSYLKEKHPDHNFYLVMGGDNILNLHKWKNYDQILENYAILVYQRPGYELGSHALANHKKITVLDDAPLLNISASYIRDLIKSGKSIQYLVPDNVYEYIEGTSFYK
jgi:nicotinate-nucleotide adenylyltransferase